MTNDWNAMVVVPSGHGDTTVMLSADDRDSLVDFINDPDNMISGMIGDREKRRQVINELTKRVSEHSTDDLPAYISIGVPSQHASWRS